MRSCAHRKSLLLLLLHCLFMIRWVSPGALRAHIAKRHALAVRRARVGHLARLDTPIQPWLWAHARSTMSRPCLRRERELPLVAFVLPSLWTALVVGVASLVMAMPIRADLESLQFCVNVVV